MAHVGKMAELRELIRLMPKHIYQESFQRIPGLPILRTLERMKVMGKRWILGEFGIVPV